MAGDALVIGLAKKVKRGQKSSADDEPAGDDDEGMSLDEAEDDAVDEMAGILGVNDEDKGAFKSALADFVRACMKKDAGGEY